LKSHRTITKGRDFIFWLGFAPDPTGGAPPDSLAGL